MNPAELRNSRIRVVLDTIGGATYYIEEKWEDGSQIFQPYCLRPSGPSIEENTLCGSVAGIGTTHHYTGACHNHGGKAGAPPKIGRYSDITRKDLRKRYASYAQELEPLNLMDEIALQRALLGEAMIQFQDQKSLQHLRIAMELLRDITRSVERIETIQSQQLLTTATGRLMLMVGMSVARRYVDDSRIPEFMMEWKQEVLGKYAPKMIGGIDYKIE